MGALVDLTGRRFGRLTVLSESGRDKRGKCLWRCRCECGTETTVASYNLRSGCTTSCGCRQRETGKSNRTHGMYGTPEHNVWRGMIQRCSDPNRDDYHRYGARGIKVCERWLGPDGFVNFLADMGPRPSPDHSIDRYPNNDGNYEPGNCRWATPKEQANNRRKRRAA